MLPLLLPLLLSYVAGVVSRFFAVNVQVMES